MVANYYIAELSTNFEIFSVCTIWLTSEFYGCSRIEYHYLKSPNNDSKLGARRRIKVINVVDKGIEII